jgi:insertion element IS1 protein InsB
VLEVDELRSFVLKKARQGGVWPALCRQSRPVVAYFVGDRSAQTCRRLWEAIPAAPAAAHVLPGLLGGVREGAAP